MATRTCRTSKEQYVYYAKQQLCTCITLFCTFLNRPCTTTMWKCLKASFMQDVNKRWRISFSLPKLECAPQEINSREIRLHLPFSANWNESDKDWKKREFILKLTFLLPLPSSMLKVPIVYQPAPSVWAIQEKPATKNLVFKNLLG